MRILITGYTSRMVGSNRVRGDYLTFVYLLEDMLNALGHQVERREVKIGEALMYNYDYAFLGVAPLNSISAARVPETHYVMEQLPGRHCIYADDWSFCGFGDSVRYGLKRWNDYLKYKNYPYSEHIMEATKESLRVMATVTVGGNNAPVLAPMFKWGDHEFLMRDNYHANLIWLDPSAWVKFPTTNIPTKILRHRQWVMAALSNHTKWIEKQGFKFPVKYIGNSVASGNVFLTENGTIQLFADSFGILSTGYPSSGSGWWRTRFLNAAWAETLVYCDKRDQVIMGEAYQGTPEYFESLYKTPKYNEVIMAQGEWLEKQLMDKEESLEVLRRLLK